MTERKKSVRAAHRSSVTRTITAVNAIIGPDSTAEVDVPKLKQKERLLKTKIEVLAKLDEEILESAPEEELEEEVQQADEYVENIELTVSQISEFLAKLESTDERSLHPIPKPSTETVQEEPIEPTHERPSGEGSHHSRESTPTSSRPRTPTSDMEAAVPHTPRVKLPKLSLKRFNGDLAKWITFWDTYESTVHENPSLTSIDKFNYLSSLLEYTAAEAISGLTRSSANYEEAVAILKRRFGNKQLIVNRHMDSLVKLEPVSSQHDVKALRRFYDAVESNVRGLKALGVPRESYGALLSSVVISKLPPEMRLIVSREMDEEDWDLKKMMEVMEREIRARERSGIPPPQQKTPQRGTSIPPTASSLLTGVTSQITCVYCSGPHPSSSCSTVKGVETRKQILYSSGRCYVCLRRNHISRRCRSKMCCPRCRGRHHESICDQSSSPSSPAQSPSNPLQTRSASNTPQAPIASDRNTSTLCISSQTPVLLQTAKVLVMDVKSPNPATAMEVRAVLDPGSQRSYVSTEVRDSLQLKKTRTESLVIKTFGNEAGTHRTCDVVNLGLRTLDGGMLQLSTVVVPHICNPMSIQPIASCKLLYSHIAGLKLADPGETMGELKIDVLIGSDYYWEVVTGKIVKGQGGPVAIETKLGWVLSGPIDKLTPMSTAINLISSDTHTLSIDVHSEPESLEQGLKQFWELESLGISKDEPSMCERFIQQISFDGERYCVTLPWKNEHPNLPDNLVLCRKRLDGLMRRLKQNPQMLKQYDSVIRSQLQQGIIEIVSEPDKPFGPVHYLPHHPVIREDKTTTKLRIVYDASAKEDGPSLNECLYTGPKSGQSILDILLRFRVHEVAVVGDIEKAFLMIMVAQPDRDALRFLWFADVNDPQKSVAVMRFTRVIFGVSSSPFLLTATLNHHMRKLLPDDQQFVDKFLRSIYVDDVTGGAHDVQSAYHFYTKSKSHLAKASFNLRKFSSNSLELERMVADDRHTHNTGDSCEVSTRETERVVLGVRWNIVNDELIFDVSDISCTMNKTEPTKRNAVSIGTKFFDPLGILTPLTVRFKLLFQHLCEAQVEWDEPLTGELLTKWNALKSDLQYFAPITVPRCYSVGIVGSQEATVSLKGFCDASLKAYAAAVYIEYHTGTEVTRRFICAKSRITPLKKITIPRLELLSALLLSRLISTVQEALKPELEITAIDCYTDSQVALCWIRGTHREWKQFVHNRVTEIRALVPPVCWKHCPGTQNPADIPSRGVTSTEMPQKVGLWLHGPGNLEGMEPEQPQEDLPEECIAELKKETQPVAVSLITHSTLDEIFPCTSFSSLKKLLRVTGYVLKFIGILKKTHRASMELSPEDLEAALVYWVKISQKSLFQEKEFNMWSHQFQLFQDDLGLWRCEGRLANSDVLTLAKHPIFLNRNHHIATLVVRDCHKRTMHSGVKSTLTEVRSRYWIVKGRQFVRKIIFRCVKCRKHQAKPYQPPPPPPLPSFRVQESQPFASTGVDFAGPLFVKDTPSSTSRKVWICLYTCCTTRAVHLDLVPDMSAQAFIRSFKRFAARRGFPIRMVSDNAKTFKAASKTIRDALESPETKQFYNSIQLKWNFNLERAPWWGGLFERMVQSTKKCLRKTIGSAKLTYDELLTALTEVEGILNSRPLTYISSDDVEEPLTPSHLLTGFRILNLPDPTQGDDSYLDEEPVVNQEILTRRMKHLRKSTDDFWRRWRSEYLNELREAHRYQQNKTAASAIKPGDVVIVHDPDVPRGLWKLGRVQDTLPGVDGQVRGALVKVVTNDKVITLRRPLQRLYPLEVPGASVEIEAAIADGVSATPEKETEEREEVKSSDVGGRNRPRRKAYQRAQDKLKVWVDALKD